MLLVFKEMKQDYLLRRTGFSSRYIIIGLTVAVLVLLAIVFRVSLTRDLCYGIHGKPKKEIICFEEETKDLTGLEKVKPVGGRECRDSIYRTEIGQFTQEEQARISECIKKYPNDFWIGHDTFWAGDTQFIRHTHHTYLNENSKMIEVGGNIGYDAERFIKRYNPSVYVILEPLKFLYKGLTELFEDKNNVFLYNVGVGKKNEKFMLKMEGNLGDATSPFFGTGKGTCSLKVANATEFFIRLGVGCDEFDLITINCEGCEYDLLEVMVETNIIKYFKNVQFATHSKLATLKEPVKRYCEMQEILARTHKITYQYKFQWENWVRKN